MLGNQKTSVLKRINNINNPLYQPIDSNINHLTYVLIHQDNIDVLCIYLKDDTGKPLVFSKGPLLVTIHLEHLVLLCLHSALMFERSTCYAICTDVGSFTDYSFEQEMGICSY